MGDLGIWHDEQVKKNNIKKYGKKALCENCEGTGNQFLSMYSKCSKCNGTGIKIKNKERK